MNEPMFQLKKCSGCGWKFQTAEALRDHRLIYHGRLAAVGVVA